MINFIAVDKQYINGELVDLKHTYINSAIIAKCVFEGDLTEDGNLERVKISVSTSDGQMYIIDDFDSVLLFFKVVDIDVQ